MKVICAGAVWTARAEGVKAVKQYHAGKNEEGVRLSRFVESVTKELPASLMYKAFRNRRIKVNGKKAAPEARLHEGDLIELYVNDEFFPEPAQSADVSPKRRSGEKLCIVYEDENIAVLYKPAHLLCHSDRTGDVSLVELFCAHLQQTGEYDPTAEAAFAPALCNRLDRGTEGLVVAAKNRAALRDMNEAIRENRLQKEYLCIAVGVPPEGTHTAYLRHDERNNRVTVRAAQAPGYREIITEVKVLRKAGPLSLCEVGLITGRTHQIRAHLAFLGAPVLGDLKYGNPKMNERMGLKTQALCAAKLTFGEMAPDSVLHALSGRQISLPSPGVAAQFERLTGAQALRDANRRTE